MYKCSRFSVPSDKWGSIVKVISAVILIVFKVTEKINPLKLSSAAHQKCPKSSCSLIQIQAMFQPILRLFYWTRCKFF
jgi:hypothetical protein